MRKVISIVMVLMAVLFVVATLHYISRVSHYTMDDLSHFVDAYSKTPWNMMATPIDVHFAPLHQLASFFVFKSFGLSFSNALIVAALGWLAAAILMFVLLQNFLSKTSSGIITLLFCVSPVWLHSIIWWSAWAHRLPYLLMQILAFIMYLKYRDIGRIKYAIYFLLAYIVALGFFMKAIVFPLLFFVFELCLFGDGKKISVRGLRLCGVSGVVSALYVMWYFIFTDIQPGEFVLSAWQVICLAAVYISRLGCMLLFLPIDQLWSGWVSGFFWVGLAAWSIYRRPLSAIPISGLMVLLLINFIISLWGRGWLVVFPFGSLRYYLDVIAIVAVFIAMVISSAEMNSSDKVEKIPNALVAASLLVIAIAYPTASYFSNYHLSRAIYKDLKHANKFMNNAQHSLEELSSGSSPRVLNRNFPSFVFGFMGQTLPLKDVFEKLYPRIEWVSADLARSGDYIILDSGKINKFEVNPN